MSWLCSWCQRLFSHIIGNITSRQAPLVSSPSSSPSSSSPNCTHTQQQNHSHIHHRCKRHCKSTKHNEQQQQQHPATPISSSSTSSSSSSSSTSTSSSSSSSSSSSINESASQFMRPTSQLTTIIKRKKLKRQQKQLQLQLQQQIQQKQQKKKINLLDLPNDILIEIIKHITHCYHDSPSYPPHRVVESRTYQSSSSLLSVCKKLNQLYYSSVDDLSLASCKLINDDVIHSLSFNIENNLKRLVLRNTNTLITNQSLNSISKYCKQLKSLDLSFIHSIDKDGLIPLCQSLKHTLKCLLLRKCSNVNDQVCIEAISTCIPYKLETLDLSYCEQITDTGITGLFNHCKHNNIKSSLKYLAMANLRLVTDKSLIELSKYCNQLIQFCLRGLPLMTDTAFKSICKYNASSIEGIDITLCHSLTRFGTLKSLEKYCPKIYKHIIPKFIEQRSLRQIIISSLRQNIFIVHGSDPESGLDTVHTVLIDNGDLVSASLLSSGTTDLSLLGIVLCKSYGLSLNEETKQMLEDDYGIPVTSLSD